MTPEQDYQSPRVCIGAGRFHLRDSWYFTRQVDGGVTLEAPGVQSITVPAAEWASVVASLWFGGETHASYELALDLQNGTVSLCELDRC